MMKYTPLVRSDTAPISERHHAPRAPIASATAASRCDAVEREDADRVGADAEVGGVAEADTMPP